MNKKVIIVGAGLGGLASGLLLSKKGFEVEILEMNSQAGGRLNQVQADGFTFDSGPSFFSMSYIFKEFMDKCGVEMPFKFVELDPLYSVNFRGSDKTFHLYKDIKKLAAQFEGIEPDFEQKMERYLKKSGALFHDTVDLVIKNNFDNKLDYITTLMRVNPVHLPVLFESFYGHVKKYFQSKEARQIVSLVAFFLGRTPFDTMGIYSLLSYTEFRHDGYYNVEGGMYNVVKGIVKELEKQNVRIRYSTEIVDVQSDGDKVKKLTDKNGNTYEADTFLINADAALFRNKILKRPKFSDKKLAKMEWTMGYLTFYVGIKRKLPQVNHHNYYLGGNYEEYANNVLKNPDTLQKHLHPQRMERVDEFVSGQRTRIVAQNEPDRWSASCQLRRKVQKHVLRRCIHRARSRTSDGDYQRRPGMPTNNKTGKICRKIIFCSNFVSSFRKKGNYNNEKKYRHRCRRKLIRSTRFAPECGRNQVVY